MNRLLGLMSLPLSLACLILSAPACLKEIPQKVADKQLGYKVVFPGKPTKSRYVEQTPFGEMEWFAATYTSIARFDQIFSVDVGTIPPGDLGGTYQDEILQTLKDWIKWRFPGTIRDLDPEKGPGFEYSSKSSSRYTKGVVVLRRGRFHHAKAVSESASDPELRKFMASFEVDGEGTDRVSGSKEAVDGGQETRDGGQ
jgi:hypothetical protein